MNSNKFNYMLIIFLIFQPILDVITAFQIRNNMDFITIGTFFRGIFFLIIFAYLLKNKIDKKYMMLFLIYFFLEMCYILINIENNILVEVLNIIKIFYLPFLLLFFYKYENKKIDDKFILYIYLIYLNFIIIPYIFNIGYEIYSLEEKKQGYLGLFYSGNELSALLVGLLPIVLNYVIKSKNYILKVLFYVELLLVTILLGTKTMLIGVLLVFCFYIFRYLLYRFKDNNKKTKLLIPIISVVLILSIILILPKTPVYTNFKIAMNYYKINSINDFISVDSLDKLIFSNRLSYLKNLNKNYINQDKNTIIYGLGENKILNLKDSEIDIFDIFYSIGIFGFCVWIIILLLSLKNIKLRGCYKFSFILFIVMSLFSGHVLTKPMVAIYIALLPILNKNSIKIEKKKILLVSNMYPSNKYKYYGSFVKNTKELLEENNFIVDMCVMNKQTSKLMKLFSYIKLYFGTIIKGIFNNYDYIYVHFISHSSPGAVIIKKTSRNVKLVLNAHGNDVVADYDFEQKNILKSKKYLKYADKVVVPSNYFKEIMISEYNIDPKSIYVYPSGGVNTDKFKKLNIKECKEKCNLKDEYDYIGYISRIEKNKGWDVFLKAIKELEKEDKIGNKRFLIIGLGNEEAMMNDLIKDLDILKYLEIRSMVSQDELVNIYNSLEIFVFPTYRKSESLGLVGLEAMSCETFVIASKNYGPTDYLKDNKNGFFFEPTNEIDLKNKILEYEKLNNEQRKKISKKARETAMKYDLKNTKDLILKVFE